MGILGAADLAIEGARRTERLIFVAPRAAESSVGDHADRLLAVLRPYADEVVDLRCGGPGVDSVVDCIRLRRQVSEALRDMDLARTVVHAELSAGSVAPFWSLVGRRGVIRTATFHEPPRPVWNIFRFRLVARSRVLDNLIQRTLDRWFERFERWAMRDVGVVGTTAQGTVEMVAQGFGRRVVDARLVPQSVAPLPPLAQRPLAVGLFGYFYRGKGFDLVDQLRDTLDERIAIRIAGRGTEAMRSRPGIDVRGAVTGADEAAFFGTIRLLLLPYRRKIVWGRAPKPASAAFVSAAAHGTPCLALESAGLQALNGSGCVTVETVAALAARIEALVFSDDELARLEADQEAFRRRQSSARMVGPIVSQWRSG